MFNINLMCIKVHYENSNHYDRLTTSSDCREKDPHLQQCTGSQKTAEEDKISPGQWDWQGFE